jgi:DNA-binding NtrC family response regulator
MTSPLIGKSKTIKSIIRQINRLSLKNEGILIIGEQGTGKSLIAQHIHNARVRGNRRIPLKIVDLTRVDEKELLTLLDETEDNIPAEADLYDIYPCLIPTGGTILLREIEETSFRKQAYLLTFLDRLRDLRRGPTDKSRRYTHVIVSSKNDPLKLVQKKKMSVDLAQHITIFNRLFIPPLRERKEDIPYLVEHFVIEACKKIEIHEPIIDIRAVNILLNQPWRNNILELKTVIDRSILFSKNGIFTLPKEMAEENKARINRMFDAVFDLLVKLKQNTPQPSRPQFKTE